jgi:hypothetical protein
MIRFGAVVMIALTRGSILPSKHYKEDFDVKSAIEERKLKEKKYCMKSITVLFSAKMKG